MRRVADLARLPRDGLARRYGRRLVALLDQALGRAPDPRAPCRLPEAFEARLALLHETADSTRLAAAAGRLVQELAGWLAARCSGVSRLDLALEHRGQAPTRLSLGLAEPDREPARLEALLAERLSAVGLPAPVTGIGLAARECQVLEDETRALLPAPGERPRITRLIERLQAHLGEDAVAGVAPAADHRPERAWRWTVPGNAPDVPAPAAPRPAWLLADPAPLHHCPGGLHPGKLVDVSADPERIRAGWWDGDGRQRDYLTATCRHDRLAAPRRGGFRVAGGGALGVRMPRGSGLGTGGSGWRRIRRPSVKCRICRFAAYFGIRLDVAPIHGLLHPESPAPSP